MDTELLRTFLEVARCRHFGRAAENLYLTQSAVSARVKQLEAKLDTELFYRHRNNIQLTPAGSRLMPHAEALLAGWQRAAQDIALGSSETVQLAIGASPNIWEVLLAERISDLFADAPGIAVRAEALGPDTLIRQLLERTLDIALMFDPPKVDELKHRVVSSVDMVLVGTSEGTTIDDLARLDWVEIDWGLRFGLELHKALPELPTPRLYSNSARVALNYLLANEGFAYLPAVVTEKAQEGGRLAPVAGAPVIQREIYASWLGGGAQTEAVQRLAQQLQSSLSAGSAQVL
ncbi:LysR substrate-binding domain-containing protein [Biformimicrobium ophioploci]|uniref:HTH-type transcriptional regulator HdfR n=1 Tax=Biformimicrobium ophioploci TaxID=3036711 RepID=A0ABQ6LVQ5_9GAMM|nr:LysR substrate-binding domain-containing protein [Microbulbifer sp. NKW57]GMG86171.1 HTH-type transcriptional regulator HdfR [Microbulbifer sp. NKW57]